MKDALNFVFLYRRFDMLSLIFLVDCCSLHSHRLLDIFLGNYYFRKVSFVDVNGQSC